MLSLREKGATHLYPSSSYPLRAGRSTAPCDEARHPGFHHGVEPGAGRDAADFLHRRFRYRRDVVVFAGAVRIFGRGQDRGSALDTPRKEHLRRGLRRLLGDGNDDRVFERAGTHPVPDGREGEQDDALRLAKIEQVVLRMVRMRLHLDDRGFDPGRVVDRLQDFQVDVGQADGPALFLRGEGLHGAPGVEQRGGAIVDDLAPGVARIEVVARLERERRVDQVRIDIIDFQSPATSVEGRLDPLRPVVRIPELRRDEDVLALDRAGRELRLQGLADFLFVAIAFRTVEVPEAHLQGVPGRGPGFGRIGNQRTESERRDGALSVVQGHVRLAQVG